MGCSSAACSCRQRSLRGEASPGGDPSPDSRSATRRPEVACQDRTTARGLSGGSLHRRDLTGEPRATAALTTNSAPPSPTAVTRQSVSGENTDSSPLGPATERMPCSRSHCHGRTLGDEPKPSSQATMGYREPLATMRTAGCPRTSPSRARRAHGRPANRYPWLWRAASGVRDGNDEQSPDASHPDPVRRPGDQRRVRPPATRV